MTIEYSGNVGIGTTTPDKLLTVKSATTNTQIAKFADDARYIGLGRDAIGAYDLAGNPANLYLESGSMTINTTGNVGIGTLTPGRKLEIIPGSATEDPFAIRSKDLLSYPFYISLTGDDGKLFLRNDANTDVVSLSSNGVSYFNGGNVGIGTTTPVSKLTVIGGISSTSTGSTFMEIGGPAPSPTNGQATFYFHHYSNIAHQLRYAYGRLTLEAAGNGYGTTATPEFQVNGSLFAAINGGNVGIGTTSPGSKVVIQPPATWDDNVPLFEVKNKYGTPVLAVYNNGVRILVGHDPVKGITKGGFAIGGFDNTKTVGETVNLMTVAPDSIRFNIDNDNAKGNTKGGFAIGSFDVTKAVDPRGFMNITPGANLSSNYNTFLGFEAGKNMKGPHNTSIGKGAGMSMIGSGSAANIFIGEGAGLKNSGGYSTYTFLLPDGSSITGFNSYGGENVAIGYYSGVSLAGDWQHTSWGQKNVLLGNFSGFKLNTGSNNVIIGHGAGQNLLTGKGNIFIGYQAGQNETTSDKLYIDNHNDATPLIYGDLYNDFLTVNGELTVTVNAYKPGGGSWLATSDERLKDIHGSFKRGLNEILNLNPVYFSYSAGNSRNLPSEKEYVGFVAQSVKNYLPEAVITGKDGYFDLDMHVINVALVNAVKEQEVKIEKQQQQIDRLEKIVEEMQAMMGKSGGK